MVGLCNKGIYEVSSLFCEIFPYLTGRRLLITMEGKMGEDRRVYPGEGTQLVKGKESAW